MPETGERTLKGGFSLGGELAIIVYDRHGNGQEQMQRMNDLLEWKTAPECGLGHFLQNINEILRVNLDTPWKVSCLCCIPEPASAFISVDAPLPIGRHLVIVGHDYRIPPLPVGFGRVGKKRQQRQFVYLRFVNHCGGLRGTNAGLSSRRYYHPVLKGALMTLEGHGG